MKKPIIEVLLSSEKRKKVLLLLQDGPREMETLLRSLNTTRTALLPQLKILKESHLISQSGDTYESTTIGKLIVADMISFLRTAYVFGGNCDYLGTHYIDFIPAHLLEKLPEIGSCKVIDIAIPDMFSRDRELFEKAVRSKYWLEATSLLYPAFHEFYAEMLEHEIDISIIMTRDVYEKAKHDHYDHFKEIIDIKLISLYLYPKNMEFASLIVTDECTSLKLLTQEGAFDNKKMHICGQAASEWGKELFEHYRQRSTLIIEI